MTDTPHNILVIKLGALGDFIQALGPIAAIRKHHKGAKITLLTTKPFKRFAEECGHFDEIWLDDRPKLTNISGWMALRKKFNQAKFTRVYDLQNNDRTGFYFKLFSPKPEWVGVAKGASHRNTSPERTKGHAFNGHVQTLGLAGIKDIEVDKMEWMVGDIESFDLQKPYALLVPGCAPDRPEKRWPPEHYAELARILQDQNIQPVIIGTDAEKEATAIIKKQCPEALDLINQTNFHQIATLARTAHGAIGNDTGPMHIIGASGCTSLVLFSHASNPVKHAPQGANIAVIQKESLSTLSAQTVFEKFQEIAAAQK